VNKFDDIQFFDSLSGRAKIWYFQSTSGEFELYSQPGHHPAYGDELKPVTRAAVRHAESPVLPARPQGLGDRSRSNARTHGLASPALDFGQPFAATPAAADFNSFFSGIVCQY
jgi:hypothetical protein